MFDSIKNDQVCEYLVIGGGIAGLLAAKELAERGKEVTVAEKNEIGTGRTAVGKDVIFDDGGIALERKEGINIRSFCETFSGLMTELEKTAELVLEKSYQKRGLFIFSDSPKGRSDMRRRHMIEKFRGKEAEFLLGEDADADFSFDYDSAVFAENGAATINAISFAKKIASYLSINGSLIAENTEIATLVPTENGFTAKTDNGSTITAKKVIDTRCSSKKRTVFSAKTMPIQSSLGWPQDCVIRDTYKNRMTFYRTEIGQIAMTYEKRRLTPVSFGTEHEFSYMQSVLSSMFFAMSGTLFKEKRIIYEEPTGIDRARIRLSQDIPNLFIFDAPYSNGILSALRAAKEFGSTVNKS